jgi:hypothetical protein
MIGSQEESDLFYDRNKQTANQEGLPVGEVVGNVIMYYKIKQSCTRQFTQRPTGVAQLVGNDDN